MKIPIRYQFAKLCYDIPCMYVYSYENKKVILPGLFTKIDCCANLNFRLSHFLTCSNVLRGRRGWSHYFGGHRG